MTSQQRSRRMIAWCTVLALGVAGLFWLYFPRKFRDVRRAPEGILAQNQLGPQQAVAPQRALPNAAPDAETVEGPAAKIVPVRLTWQDEQGESGGVDELNGCIMANPGTDVIWDRGDLFVMKQKGILRRVWTCGMIDSPYGPMHRGHLSSVCYDGKFVWASASGFSQPRLIVLDPQNEKVWEISTEDVPRDADPNPGPKSFPRLAVAPWEPGTVVAAGWPGKIWLAMLGFDPEQGKSVEPLPEPVNLERKRRDLLPNGESALIAAGMWATRIPAPEGGKPIRRLLIGRERPPNGSPPAWSVDLEMSQFDLVGGDSLASAMAKEQFAVGDGALYWLQQAMPPRPQAALMQLRLPQLAEQVALNDVPNGQPVFDDGWLWLLGDGCFRWQPGAEQIQSIKVDVPWRFGFRDPAEAAGRNATYYTISRAYPSYNYGLLVTTQKQETNAYNQLGKFFQFALADDPRLESEPSGELPPEIREFADDAPPGAIVSVLELMAPDPSADGRTLAVLGSAVEVGEIPEDVNLPILAREIVRQALLSAARDRLGWLTRDAGLFETRPDEHRQPFARFVLSMRFPNQAPAKFELKRVDGQGKPNSVWGEELQIYPSAEIPCQYGKLAEAAERWSREEFPQLLAQADLPANLVARGGDGKVPSSAETQLEELNFASQFLALEELHDVVRREGASPALIGALVRGYVHLGVLTEHHWSAVHKSCKARALLYGQQLAAANPASAWSLWHRAYAEALSGIHNEAQNDLATAEKLTQAPAAGAVRVERPEWVDLIAAFCRFDDEPLSAAANDERHGQLARLLQFLAVEPFKHSRPAQELMDLLLAENPECFRVHDARSWGGSLGTRHVATVEAPAMLQTMLPQRLRAVDGLPHALSKTLEREEQDQEFVADVARTLWEVDRDEDGDELSWRLLGALIEETQFMQLWRRADFMRNSWSVPADDYIHAAAPLIARHRYRALLDLFLTTPQPDAAVELENRLELSELDFDQQAHFAKLLGGQWESHRASQYRAAAKRPEQHMDDVHRDFCAFAASLEGRPERSLNKEVVVRMRKVSPDSPDAAAAWINVRGRAIQSEAAELEKKFARHAQVWRALAYNCGWDKEPRIRYLRKCVELTHDFWAYDELASVYRQNREYDEWVAVLEEALTQPSRGLEDDHIRSQIAGHYMRRHEWNKALPYALDAAESWAEWAMSGAAACYEGLSDSENEGLWRTRIVERYPSEGNSFDLYLWARRTGLGDAQLLARQLDPVISEWAKNAPERQQQVGVFYQLNGDLEPALAAYQKAAQERSDLHNTYMAQLRAVLVAHELGRTQARDQALKALISIGDPALSAFQQVGAWLAADLVRPPQKQADLATAREAIASAVPHYRPVFNFAVGRYLQLRDKPEEARPFLDAAASSADSLNTLTRVLAAASLRDRGEEPSKLKTEPIPDKAPSQPSSPPGQQ